MKGNPYKMYSDTVKMIKLELALSLCMSVNLPPSLQVLSKHGWGVQTFVSVVVSVFYPPVNWFIACL